MRKVYKYVDQEDADNSELIEKITEIFVLAITSIFVTFLNGIGSMVSLQVSELALTLNWAIISLGTNFWCIILLYQVFDDGYLKMCGYWHSICKECWYNCKIEEEENDEIYV